MGILDPKFRYVPASRTDIRKTFARWRAFYKAEAEAKVAQVEADKAEAEAKVVNMKRGKK